MKHKLMAELSRKISAALPTFAVVVTVITSAATKSWGMICVAFLVYLSIDYRCSSDYTVMKELAYKYDSKIRDVPGDGDCFFHAVSFSLPSVGLPATSGPELRSQLIRHFKTTQLKHKYMEFLSISEADSPRLIAQQQIHSFELYIDGLCRGNWADNLAVQGVADMLNININVICTNSPNCIINVRPRQKKSETTILIGLLQELHYVAFEKL